jgi:hypothetical protein
MKIAQLPDQWLCFLNYFACLTVSHSVGKRYGVGSSSNPIFRGRLVAIHRIAAALLAVPTISNIGNGSGKGEEFRKYESGRAGERERESGRAGERERESGSGRAGAGERESGRAGERERESGSGRAGERERESGSGRAGERESGRAGDGID